MTDEQYQKLHNELKTVHSTCIAILICVGIATGLILTWK